MKPSNIVSILFGTVLLMGMGFRVTGTEEQHSLQFAQAGRQADIFGQRSEGVQRGDTPQRGDSQGRQSSQSLLGTPRTENKALQRIEVPTQVERLTEPPLERQQREFYESQKLPPPQQQKPEQQQRAVALGTCVQGYVWREAIPGDHVCVTPEARGQAQRDNNEALNRRDPKGAQGPNTCVEGYVWREAAPGDYVCVRPEVRAQAQRENTEAVNRMAREPR